MSVMEESVAEQVEEPKEAKDQLIEKLQSRINDQSKIIASLQKEFKNINTKLETFSPPPQQQQTPPPTQSEAMLALEKKAIEREQRASQKSIKSAVVSAMIDHGMSHEAAKKLLPAMLAETEFEIDEDDAVLAKEGESKTPADVFVKAVLLRDDWRVLLPQKKAPEKSKGKPAPVASPIAPVNDHGVFSAKDIQSRNS